MKRQTRWGGWEPLDLGLFFCIRTKKALNKWKELFSIWTQLARAHVLTCMYGCYEREACGVRSTEIKSTLNNNKNNNILLLLLLLLNAILSFVVVCVYVGARARARVCNLLYKRKRWHVNLESTTARWEVILDASQNWGCIFLTRFYIVRCRAWVQLNIHFKNIKQLKLEKHFALPKGLITKMFSITNCLFEALEILICLHLIEIRLEKSPVCTFIVSLVIGANPRRRKRTSTSECWCLSNYNRSFTWKNNTSRQH